jgi:hypothetical protein
MCDEFFGPFRNTQEAREAPALCPECIPKMN